MTAMRIRGVRTPVLRSIAGDLARQLREKPATTVELASALVATGGYSERTFAYLLLSRHRAAFASLRAGQLEALAGGNDNWGSVDAFGTLVAGPAWLAGQLDAARVERWARSPDRWWRRTALVSTTALNKKSAGSTADAPRTLAICALLLDDRGDMVVKAESWALRALSERDPDAVRAFLDAHEHALAARVPREVRHKLETGLKHPRRTKAAS